MEPKIIQWVKDFSQDITINIDYGLYNAKKCAITKLCFVM